MMTKPEFANAAKSHTKLIDIENKSVARSRVPTDSGQCVSRYAKIKSITHVGVEDVYNMEVEKYQNFSVSGGLVVHNCLDALRYAYEDEMLEKKLYAVNVKGDNSKWQ